MSGPKSLAEDIKTKATEFLQSELKIQVNTDKTRTTHLKTEKAHFLGVDILRRDKNYEKTLVTKTQGLLKRKVNNRIIMYAPIDRIINKLVEQNYAHPDKRPRAMLKWIHLNPEEIVMRYNAVILGILNYYNHVENRNMLSLFNWIMLFSAAFTLAKKLNISPAKVFKKYGKRLTINYDTNKSTSLSIPDTLARKRMNFQTNKDKTQS